MVNQFCLIFVPILFSITKLDYYSYEVYANLTIFFSHFLLKIHVARNIINQNSNSRYQIDVLGSFIVLHSVINN